MIVYVAPVWMGQPAFTLRTYLKRLKASPRRYAFISICGGATGRNEGLERTLTQRAGRPPEAVAEMIIADLLPSEPKPTMKDEHIGCQTRKRRGWPKRLCNS